LLRGDPAAGYSRVSAPRTFSFPDDHGPHPGYRNEWWYFTGNLDDPGGRRFGYELTIFRFALQPDVSHPGSDVSGWRSDEVFIGHFAVTDTDNEDFHVAERYSRAALGLAGATTVPVQAWIEDWSITRRPATGRDRGAPAERWHLQANQDDIGLELTLTPEKKPVPNGVDGLSQKSAEPGNASYYYSVPRLRTEGIISIGAQSFAVSGLSWLDREWGSSGLAADQQGWDWFALQLADGSDLMFYRLRRTGGATDPWSAGTWMPADGSPMHLSAPDVDIEVRNYWESPLGGRYPMDWTLTVPTLDLSLRIRPVVKSQELATSVRYWEGAVDVNGERNGKEVSGRGYVELTGYADDPT
jgi:predicted secreted hydrolase